MYTKEMIKAAFTAVFRGAGEMWFPYVGRDEDVDLPVAEQWQKMDAALTLESSVLSRTPSDEVHRLSVAELARSLSDPDDLLYRGPTLHAPDVDSTVPPDRRAALPRVFVVGYRRFTREPGHVPVCDWTWERMLRSPSVDRERTPAAWQRLESVGLAVDVAVDLLPPGSGVDEAAAVKQARYVQGVLAGLETAGAGPDAVCLLGGKVSRAFRAADARLRDVTLLEMRHGFVTLPSPHVVEHDGEGWWSSEAKLSRLRGVVGKIMARRCQDCVNGDSEVGGCVECGTHAADCAGGSFCVQCRRGGEVARG